MHGLDWKLAVTGSEARSIVGRCVWTANLAEMCLIQKGIVLGLPQQARQPQARVITFADT
jgi:hypothetical protein